MDRKIGRVGAAADMATEELAKSEAMKQCGKLSSAVCAVDVAYTNGCVAIGWPSEGGIVVDNVDSDIQKAKSGALQKCADTNGAACEITYAECSKPVFEPFQY